MASERRKVRIGAQAGFQLCRLPVRPSVRSGPTNTGPVAKPSRQNTGASNSTGLSGPRVRVIDRLVNSHRKTGSPRPTTHETHSVASQKQLEGTGISGKIHSTTQVTAPTLALVASRKQCSNRPTITPGKTCSADLYRRIKRRVGRSLKRAHCKRNLVPPGKQAAHKLLRTQSRVSSFKTVTGPLLRQDSPSGNRQHHNSVLHKQGRRHEVGPIMCPSVEDLDLVFQKSSDFEGPTYSRLTKRGSRQTIPARPSHTDRMVPPSRDFRIDMQQVAPTSNRSVRHEVQQQAPLVCVTGSGPIGHCSGCTQPATGESGRICLPTDSHFRQSDGEVAGLPVPKNDSDWPGVAQHALVLGPSGIVQPDPSEPASSAQSPDTAFQSDPSQESPKPQSPCLAPRATAIKEQGFSEAVAARIEAPQRGSTRSVYEAKWTIFTKWCLSNKVDFRSPPIKSVADFLMYLFEERKLQPSTIDGYRSAIADKLGSSALNIGKDENLTRLLDSFHRDRPKGRRGIPSWNLSLVLHQLTKAPFEPIKEASLKLLTFKTVFLLALGSGKRRSEIHAWQNKNISHQSD